ncbi:hypothetical protein Taro_003332 [Colocasia esculenta]|uniref:Uncharacterized protein n=1 Tax=Colocasia esculenta TaxID=4460 RepID=A0A843TNC3_COLES|nr:hypothetical protein [Colocasia esculenta]
MTNKVGVSCCGSGRGGAAWRDRRTGRSGLVRVGNAVARPVAFMTRPEGRPRHSSYRGVSRRRDNRGGPGFSLFLWASPL